jgi:hypothetical protein
MSSYEQSFRSGQRDTRDLASCPEEFREAYPSLASVFAGSKPAEGEAQGIPAATVNLWFEGGELHFCIMPRFGNRVAFGLAGDGVKGFDALEQAISQGQFGWKISKSRKSA